MPKCIAANFTKRCQNYNIFRDTDVTLVGNNKERLIFHSWFYILSPEIDNLSKSGSSSGISCDIINFISQAHRWRHHDTSVMPKIGKLNLRDCAEELFC